MGSLGNGELFQSSYLSNLFGSPAKGDGTDKSICTWREGYLHTQDEKMHLYGE